MMYLTWALVNTAAFFYLIYLVFTKGKLLRERLGLGILIVLVLVVLSFRNHPDKQVSGDPDGSKTEKWTFASRDSLYPNETIFKDVNIEGHLINQCNLGIDYGFDKVTRKHVPIEAFVTISGWITGTEWKTTAIQVDQTPDNEKFSYTVEGTVDWNLLGITFYTQSKTLRGVVKL